MKRFLAILLVIAMLPIPATFAREAASPAVIPESAFDAVTADVWEDIEAIEETQIVAVRGKKATAADYAAIVDDVIAAVEASDTYVEGSINRNGNFFTWRTTEGVACGYSPRLRAQVHNTAIEGADPEKLASVETTSYAVKGGSPSATNVAVFQPYYGLDSSFKTTYSDEGKSIAQALGGSSTTYTTTAATIDAIADAFETCGVVIFDSHGDTDYANPSNDDDFVSRANTSYLLLQTNTGITSADMATVSGTYGSYQHAYYAGSYGSMKYYCVDGTAIANHMEKTAPHSMLWSAICLGMATNGLHAPLRAKGVEVAYGYSQSVTFYYDYQWEAVFWDNMIAGNNVAASIAAMKSQVGNWDYVHEYSTVTEARNNYAAFPIVVSSEDTYPGKGNVDNLQTVNSTWKLKEGTTPTEPTSAPTEPTTAPGSEEYSLTTSLKDGDQVIIYNAGAGKAMSEDAVSTNYRAGVDVTVSNNKIVTDDTKIVWTVKEATGGFMFLNDDGDMLSATKGLSYATTDNVWAVNTANTANSVYISSTTATGTSGDPKMIEWYDKYTEFSTYYYSEANEGIFAMQLFVKGGSVTPTEPTTAPTEPTTAPTEPTTAPSGNEYVLTTSLKDGDEVVIYNAGAGKAMSEDAVSTNYRAGVAVTPSGNKIVTDDSKIVWKVKASGEGFTFSNDAGETLSATKGLSFATTDNVWKIETANTANSVYIVSTTATGTSGDPKMIEWYDKYTEFSTYYYSEANEGIFAMQLFVRSSGTTPTEPTTAPTEPTTAPTEPTTAPTEPTTAPTGNEYVLTTSLKDGDQVIIYNASAKKAMSEDAVSTNYRAGADVTVSNNKIVTDDSKIVWTVKDSGSGYTFANDAGETLSATKGLSFATTDNVWKIETANTANSVYIVSTTATGTSGDPKYVEWYDKYTEFSTYYYSEASEAIFAMQLFVLSGSVTPTEPTTAPTEPTSAPTEPTTAPTEPTTAPGTEGYYLADSVKTGDKIVLVASYNDKNYAMTNDTSISNALGVEEVTVIGDRVDVDTSRSAGSEVVWTLAAGSEAGTYLLKSSDGKYISWTSSTSIKLSDSGVNFTIECGQDTSSIMVTSTLSEATNRGLFFRDNGGTYQFRAYSTSNLTQSTYSGVLTIYKYTTGSTTPTEPTTAPTEPTTAPTEPTTAPTEPTTAPTEPTTAPSGNEYVLTTSLKDGDEVVIYNAGAGKAMSEDAVSTNYRAGVAVTPSGNKIVTDDSKIVWKVKVSGEGYTFANDAGETLSATKGLSFATTDNVWKIETANTANSVYIVSTTATGTSGDPKMIEWYDKYTEFSTYYYSEANEGIFAMQLFVRSSGTTPTEPTTAPTEPTTAPTEPTTAPTEPTTAPTEPTTAPSGLPFADGDCVVIYNAASGVIVGYEEDTDYDSSTGNYTYCNITTEAVTVSGTTLTADFENAGTFYAIINDDGTVYFLDQYDYDQSEDSENPDCYFLAASAPDTYYDSYTDYAAFEVIPVEGGYLLKNVADESYYAVENGVIVAKSLIEGDPSFIFQFAIWEGDSDDNNNIICTLSESTVTPTEPTTAPTQPTTAPTEPTTAPTEPTTAPSGNEYVLTTSLKDGDEVIIYNADAKKAMSEDAVSTNYRAGVDVTVSGNKIVTDNSKIVWKVTKTADGYIFSNDAGETLSATKGLSFATTDNVWAINAATTANSVYLVSTTAVGTSGDPKYVEWYDKYSEFSTYYYSEANEAIFAMQLFVRDSSVAPTEPTTAPTEPTTAPTEPTTAPTEPTTAPTEPTTAPTEPTTAPTEPTTAPTEPTTAPTQPTTAPTEPTEPAHEYKITVKSDNEAYGSAALMEMEDGVYVVIATPDNGYYAAGFILEPADAATVMQSGNRFSISDVKADCCLTVQFRAKEEAEIRFSVPAGCYAQHVSTWIDEPTPLKAPEGEVRADAHDYIFLGWTEERVKDEKVKPVYYTDFFTPEKALTTLYALYTYEYRGETWYTTVLQMETCLAKEFHDVDVKAWYHEALDFVLEYGYMNGVGDFEFAPNGKLTRGMMVTILYRLEKREGTYEHPFKDVKRTDWYAEAVGWAYENGIVNGTSSTTFSPNEPITREQAAAMLYRYARWNGDDVTPKGSLMNFVDADKVSAYARDPMRWAVGEGIIHGKGKIETKPSSTNKDDPTDILDPLGTATRAEIAQILYGWLG